MIGILIAALIGLADSAYLAWTAAMNVSPLCNFIHGCDIVAASPYAHFLGVPWGFYGVAFYFTIAAFAFWGLVARSAAPRWYLRVLGLVGFLMSLYFTSLEAFVIHAWCEYCLLSALMASAIFVLSFFIPKMLPLTDAQDGGHGS